MFESIKLKIIRGRQLNPFATAKVLQDHEDRLKALEGKESGSGNEQQQEQQQQEQTPTTYDLSFTVNDGTDPIKGATVKIGSTTGTTGDVGGCTLKDIAEGSQSVEVSATGYVTKTETITVSSSKTSFTISLVADQVVSP